MLFLPVFVCLRLFCLIAWIISHCSWVTIASWVSSNIFHCDGAFFIVFLFLNDFTEVLKLTVCPRYSSLCKISDTVLAAHRCLVVGSCPEVDLPILCQYSVGVGTFSFSNCFAICDTPLPAIQRLKIFLTTSAAATSTTQYFEPFGSFL